jgi:hypothetical protein
MSEFPTEINAEPDSARRFREEVQRETRAEFRDQQRTLREITDRLTALETLFKLHIQELEQWRKANAGPLEAASKLDHATHGARMMVVAVFGVCTCILAVAGVLQLGHSVWRQLTQ